MKNVKWMLALSLVVVSSMAVAQSIGENGVRAQVPFAFTVGDRTIPAGQCAVMRLGDNPNVLVIRNQEARTSLMATSSQSEAKTTSADTVMVFERYGDRYFLSAIRLEGSNRTYHLPRSKAENELRAQNVPATEQTLLASLN